MPPALRAKQENGSGTITRQSNGNYRWRATIGLDATGKPIRATGTATSRQAALAAISAAKTDSARGSLPTPDRTRVGDFLDDWLEQKADLKAKSVSNYRGLIERHIKPVVGHLRLQKLTPLHLQSVYKVMREKGLGDTQRQVHSLILRPALEHARHLRIIRENPAADVKPRLPRDTKVKTDKALDPEEVSKLMPVLKADRWGLPLEFVLHTGLRRGELCGLQWTDVNLTEGTVRIRHNRTVVNGQPRMGPTKTVRGDRVLPLTHEALDCLARQRAQQTLERQALLPGPMPGHAKAKTRSRPWVDSGFVFTQIYGTPLHPDTLMRYLKAFCTQADVGPATNHMLRHTFASLMLRQGVPLEVVSRMLGHERPSFTADTYRHVYPDELPAHTIPLSELLKPIRHRQDRDPLSSNEALPADEDEKDS